VRFSYLYSPYGQAVHTDKDHKNKAEHDLKIAEQLLADGNYPDWVITCSFYTALHFVDAYAHKLGITSFEPRLGEKMSSHGKRLRFVSNQLRQSFSSYKRLYDRCRQARYDPQYYKLMMTNVPVSAVKDARTFSTLK
jgi:hypothetical protein